MSRNRQACRNNSNNLDNPNQNLCCLAIAQYYGVHNEVRYLHCVDDLVRALRTRYTVRSRGSKAIGKTVGKIRSKLPALAAEVGAVAFLVRVDGHVLTLKPNGDTLTDTDPRQRDKRKIMKMYVIY